VVAPRLTDLRPHINASDVARSIPLRDTGAYAESYKRVFRIPPFCQAAAHAWTVGTRQDNNLEGGGMIRSQQAGDVRRGNHGIIVPTPEGTP
jgi:hypothetical protein